MKAKIDNLVSSFFGLKKIDELHLKLNELADRISEVESFFGKLFGKQNIIIGILNKEGKILYADGDDLKKIGYDKTKLINQNIYKDLPFLADLFDLGKNEITIFRRGIEAYKYLCIFFPINGLVISLYINITNITDYPEVVHDSKR